MSHCITWIALLMEVIRCRQACNVWSNAHPFYFLVTGKHHSACRNLNTEGNNAVRTQVLRKEIGRAEPAHGMVTHDGRSLDPLKVTRKHLRCTGAFAVDEHHHGH